MSNRKGSPELFQVIIQEYDVKTVNDLQEALKNLLGVQ